jgi:putative transposase
VWHLDEMAVRIGGKQHWLWRAIDEHGATLEVLLQEHRDTDAAERFFRMLLGRAGGAPERINTDKLGSYAAALRRLPDLAGVDHQQVRSAQRGNNRVEQAHQPTRVRERRMGRFRCAISAQRFLAVFTRTWNLFRPRRRSSTATQCRTALQDRFTAWQVAAGLRA